MSFDGIWHVGLQLTSRKHPKEKAWFNLEAWGSSHLCLSVCVSVSVSHLCLSICVLVSVSHLCLSVCVSQGFMNSQLVSPPQISTLDLQEMRRENTILRLLKLTNNYHTHTHTIKYTLTMPQKTRPCLKEHCRHSFQCRVRTKSLPWTHSVMEGSDQIEYVIFLVKGLVELLLTYFKVLFHCDIKMKLPKWNCIHWIR